MMYSAMVGVELLYDVADTNERVDALALETAEGVEKAQANVNKLKVLRFHSVFSDSSLSSVISANSDSSSTTKS